MLGNIWKKGWEKIKEMEITQARKRLAERRERKRQLSKYVLRKVQELRVISHTVDLNSVPRITAAAPWRDYIRSLRPSVYSD